MQYFIKRGEQSFGPYNLSEIQQYVQSGNILLDDLTQSEGMGDWIPVSQVLGNIPAAVPAITDPSGFVPLAERVSLPPNLPWWVLLILVAFTRQVFNLLWAIVQANWARKLSGNNKALVLVAMYPAGFAAGILTMALNQRAAALGGLFIIAGLIAMVVGVFTIKADMEHYYRTKENIGLVLSGAMTFFFGTIYLQYHINQLASMKKRGVLQ